MDVNNYTHIITLLQQIEKNQNSLYEKSTQLETRIDNIEQLLKNIHKSKKPSLKKMVVRRKVLDHPTLTNDIKLIGIDAIRSCEPKLKHIDIVFFSSLEFTFCIVLLETLFEMSNIDNECTKFVYEEAEFCDNHYQLDIKSQLLRICGWFEDHESRKVMLPFKKQTTVDVDKKIKNTNNIPLIFYYKNQWCSSSYKNKLLSLYEGFCIKTIQRFGEWQDTYNGEIERNKLPKNLDYSECVLKIMGSPEKSNSTSKIVDEICGYLSQMV